MLFPPTPRKNKEKKIQIKFTKLGVLNFVISFKVCEKVVMYNVSKINYISKIKYIVNVVNSFVGGDVFNKIYLK